MKLTHLSNQQIIISRPTPVNGSVRNLILATVTVALGHLQPVAPEKVALLGGVFGKTYRIFVEHDIDILEGDQLKDEANNIYTVTKGGITKWQHGAMDYQEVIIQRT
jgi:hypothetical protein